jgi:hypothetical protein
MEPGSGSMAPAYDIDLVWHTHQLSATYRYLISVPVMSD